MSGFKTILASLFAKLDTNSKELRESLEDKLETNNRELKRLNEKLN
jgi:uncharacterized protein YPO0396